jgi:hypothetical protein
MSVNRLVTALLSLLILFYRLIIPQRLLTHLQQIIIDLISLKRYDKTKHLHRIIFLFVRSSSYKFALSC